MAIEHINEFDTLNAGREKINKHAIDPANRAELNAIDAKSVANQANQTSRNAEAIAINTDDRLDNIIAGEMQDAEVIDARRPFGGEAYPTLGERFDEQIGLSSDFRAFESEKSFMQRVKNEMDERGINVRWFGARGDNATNDTVAFNNALSVASSQKKIVYVPSGTYLIDHLELESNATLVGENNLQTILKRSVTSTASVFLGLSHTDVVNVNIKNLKIEGNRLANDNVCDGINFDNEAINKDSFHFLSDLNIEMFAGCGLVLGLNTRECRLSNINTSNNGLDGIFFDGTDNFVTNVSAFWNKRNGVSLGSNSSMTKILNVKAFGNDFNGFNLQGSKGNQLLNCESQDNGRCGLRISDYANNNKISVIIDSNGAIESATSAVSLSDAYNNQLSLTASTRVNYSSKYNDSLIDFLRSSYNDVDIQTQFVSSRQLPLFKNYPLITNSLKINGGDYSMFNLIEDSEFISDKKINGVSDIFDSVEVNSGVTSTYGVDRAGRTQNIDILTNTGTTIGSSGTHFLKRIICENFSVFSFGCDLYNDNQDAGFVFYLDFMDSSYNRISTHSETATLKYQFDSKIPAGTKYINIKLTYFAKKAGIRANGKISNLKIGFY